MKTRLINYIKSGYAILFVLSPEEQRVEATMRDVVLDLNKTQGDEPFSLFAWSCTDGVVNAFTGEEGGNAEPMEMLTSFQQAPQKTIYLARDFHLFMEKPNPLVWRKVKDAALVAKANNKCLVIVGCRLALPPELEKEMAVVEFALPDREQIKTVLHSLLEANGHSVESLEGDEAGILAAASGLTTTEAENAFALSVVERGKVSREVVFREKCQAVKKNGLLEVVTPPPGEKEVTLADIGGLAALKKWLLKRKNAFGDKATAYRLKKPKGFLAVGNPGTGKSLTARACKSVFELPLLRLDAAKLFGSLVGQTEANWRAVYATAKAMAPCIVWIDEVDGAMSGSASSGQTDGGTTSRTVKSILQDMDVSVGIFWVLTANDVDNLPTPLLRRMDEVWNVELPNAEERTAVWTIQLAKTTRDPALFDVQKLVSKSEGYSGAEIEKIVSEGMYIAFDEDREPTTGDVLQAMETFMPMCKTMADDIERRTKRLEGVAKLASGAPSGKNAPAASGNLPKGTRKITFDRNDE